MIARLLGPPAIRVNRMAFAFAVILTPVIFAATGVVFLVYGVFITAAAALLGLPAYLVIGVPLMWLAIRTYGRPGARLRVGSIILAAILADLIAFPFAALFFMTEGSVVSALNEALIYATLGFFAAMGQGLIFGLLYRWISGPDEAADVADVFS